MRGFEKRRGVAEPGSIPAALDIFRNEVRFYREIAPVVGVRVPICHAAEITGDGTFLALEDLSAWPEGGDPVDVAVTLSTLHDRWRGGTGRWPWLRPVGAAAGLVGALYDEVWPGIATRPALSRRVRELGDRLVGRAAAAEAALSGMLPLTICHGDACARNVRTGPGGEIALLDWEDVSAAPGVLDLAWLLTSSTEPERWDETIAAYGPAEELSAALPGAVVQGLLSFASAAEATEEPRPARATGRPEPDGATDRRKSGGATERRKSGGTTEGPKSGGATERPEPVDECDAAAVEAELLAWGRRLDAAAARLQQR